MQDGFAASEFAKEEAGNFPVLKESAGVDCYMWATLRKGFRV